MDLKKKSIEQLIAMLFEFEKNWFECNNFGVEEDDYPRMWEGCHGMCNAVDIGFDFTKDSQRITQKMEETFIFINKACHKDNHTKKNRRIGKEQIKGNVVGEYTLDAWPRALSWSDGRRLHWLPGRLEQSGLAGSMNLHFSQARTARVDRGGDVVSRRDRRDVAAEPGQVPDYDVVVLGASEEEAKKNLIFLIEWFRGPKCSSNNSNQIVVTQ